MTVHGIATRAPSGPVAWRASLLRAAGLSEELARAIAANDAHDLNSLLGLLHEGCPVATALRIASIRGHEELSA